MWKINRNLGYSDARRAVLGTALRRRFFVAKFKSEIEFGFAGVKIST
ncbi:MAG: hypothetical protein Ta2G_04220 [Termitinemataceae bacterium]|nr:MAG: hypothetical protein Ta2G_04220 [Termitinemataceae bacterium]